MSVLTTISVEVHEIRYGKLELWIDNGKLHARRGYTMHDESGAILPYIGRKDVEISTEFDSLPANLKSAVTLMMTYMENQIKSRENIS